MFNTILWVISLILLNIILGIALRGVIANQWANQLRTKISANDISLKSEAVKSARKIYFMYRWGFLMGFVHVFCHVFYSLCGKEAKGVGFTGKIFVDEIRGMFNPYANPGAA